MLTKYGYCVNTRQLLNQLSVLSVERAELSTLEESAKTQCHISLIDVAISHIVKTMALP